ncbi:Septum formation protein Maf [Actinomyces bovis]|uniref:Nucleoside triphosphate pyrophosphatase n=1 Tax=Actinomyces bovis TaxID=1658 RepID=A0ABY1VMV8_9ACTO|nr:nucleoside triphosphate pyrophosphatase [Actinomyces bovis]SPT53274.1 Septum formation protein Maf [Actinomyces bovis]VEG52564.1 Septum formation protein Maf [Actinomyces israelii]
MLVLASQSPGRLSTLRAAGVEPLVRVSQVDEPTVLAELAAQHQQSARPAPTPAEQVQALAAAKALDVAAHLTPQEVAEAAGAGGCVVVGCDSMLELDGQVLGKPGSPEKVRERWLAMRGRTAVLHSGHFLVRVADGATAAGVSSGVVHFGEPTLAEIEAYAASGEPQWCAGAFTIDGLGGAFIESIEGDPHGVVGLSLPLLRRLLAQLGVTWTELWTRSGGAA